MARVAAPTMLVGLMILPKALEHLRGLRDPGHLMGE
jgi:hypothetical protein